MKTEQGSGIRGQGSVRVIAALIVAGFAAEAFAQDQPPPRRGRRQGQPQQPQNTTAGQTPVAAPKVTDGKVTAYVGADAYTVTKEVIRNSTILIQDGKILKIGQDMEIPEGATVVDVKGKTITPGFVAMNTRGVGVRMGAVPQRGKFLDVFDPYDRMMKYALAVGITTAVTETATGGGFGRFRRAPDGSLVEEPDTGALCPCCGVAYLPYEPIVPPVPEAPQPRQHAVMKFTFGDLDQMLIKEAPFYHLNAGAMTGSLNRHQWRENMKKAKEFVKASAEHEAAVKAGKQSQPPAKTVADDFIRLVKKEISLRTDASSATQIRDMLALAKEFDYSLILDGVQEGWLTADEISAAKTPVVYTPRALRRSQPGRDDETGSFAETAGLFEKAGVTFAVSALSPSVSLDGIAGRDLTSLPLEAAFLVRQGAKERTALEALTIVPARMLGLADKVGSLEEGKDADLLVLDGPPLDYRTYVQKAIIGGKVYYDRANERVLPDKAE
jgi:imidazolonepropionase-like amidohydrolase